VVQRAARAGYVHIEPAKPCKLAGSQAALLKKKGSVWGRRLVLRALELPVTRLSGMDLR